MRLDDRVRHWIASWTGEDRQAVTLRDLLEHARACPAHRQYFESRRGRASFELAICEEPLDYPPRTQSIYSDPGFMLLGFAIENAAGDDARSPIRSLARSRARRRHRIALSAWPRNGCDRESRRPRTRRTVTSGAARCTTRTRRRSAASRRMPDLFGTAAAVGACARWWMRSPVAARCSPRRRPCPAARARSAGTPCCRPRRAGRGCRPARSATPGSPARRCGSIPRNDLYVVILTNRVHPTREATAFRTCAARCTTRSFRSERATALRPDDRGPRRERVGRRTPDSETDCSAR